MSQITRDKINEYCDYLTSGNGKRWHDQWLHLHPINSTKISDPKADKYKKSFFYSWWNNSALPGVKKAMMEEGIGYKELGINDPRCYGYRLNYWGFPTKPEDRKIFLTDFERHLDDVQAPAKYEHRLETDHCLPLLRILESNGDLQSYHNFDGYQKNWQTNPCMNTVVLGQALDDNALNGYKIGANSPQAPFNNGFSFGFGGAVNGQNTVGFTNLGQDNAYQVHDANVFPEIFPTNIVAGGSTSSETFDNPIELGFHNPPYDSSLAAASYGCRISNASNNYIHSQSQTSSQLSGIPSLMIGNDFASTQGSASSQRISDDIPSAEGANNHEKHNIREFMRNESTEEAGWTGIDDVPWYD